MYEHRSQPLLPKHLFILQVAKHILLAFGVIFGSLSIGILGYHVTDDLSWLDSLLNGSMILGGMGPVNLIQTSGGKIFASFYALFSGIVFLVTAAVLIAPVVHRFLHRLHFEGRQSG